MGERFREVSGDRSLELHGNRTNNHLEGCNSKTYSLIQSLVGDIPTASCTNWWIPSKQSKHIYRTQQSSLKQDHITQMKRDDIV